MSTRTVSSQFFIHSSKFTPAYLNLSVAELHRRAEESLTDKGMKSVFCVIHPAREWMNLDSAGERISPIRPVSSRVRARKSDT